MDIAGFHKGLEYLVCALYRIWMIPLEDRMTDNLFSRVAQGLDYRLVASNNVSCLRIYEDKHVGRVIVEIVIGSARLFQTFQSTLIPRLHLF